MTLAPSLQRLSIDPRKLLLDPNNPRLFSREEERVPLSRVQDPGFQSSTQDRLYTRDDKFRIDELIESIKRNKYIPEAGGFIFVRALPGSDYFVVLEGNRRLIALRKLLADSSMLPPDVLQSISEIEVLEIVDDLPEDKIQEKISYLLGTCHHGSHKNWSPFAQAKGIYERYLKEAGQSGAEFSYETHFGQAVASLLSITEKEVKERLIVYRAMQQLAADPRMKSKPRGGIIDHYYSLIGGAVAKPPKRVREYISADSTTFQLEPIAVERLINLCNFDGTRQRSLKDPSGAVLKDEKGKPISPALNNPSQWGYLSKILDDDDAEIRRKNLELVEEDHQKPEEVWARRHSELTKLTWKRWLEQVVGILKAVRMEEDLESVEAKKVISELASISLQLSAEGTKR